MMRVGQRTGIIYDSEELRVMERNRKSREEAIAKGKLAYAHYDPKRKGDLTVEISTGKVISGLYKYSNKYFKEYADENSLKTSPFLYLSECGEKVEITFDEFISLNSSGGVHRFKIFN